MKRAVFFLTCAGLLLAGCTVSNHGVFPKLTWYWSNDAQLQRGYDALALCYRNGWTNSAQVPTQTAEQLRKIYGTNWVNQLR